MGGGKPWGVFNRTSLLSPSHVRDEVACTNPSFLVLYLGIFVRGYPRIFVYNKENRWTWKQARCQLTTPRSHMTVFDGAKRDTKSSRALSVFYDALSDFRWARPAPQLMLTSVGIVAHLSSCQNYFHPGWVLCLSRQSWLLQSCRQSSCCSKH